MSSEHGRPQESVAETTPQGPHVAALGEESGAASGVVGADGRGVLEDAEVAARKRSIAKLRNVVWAAGPARGLVYFKVQHVRDALAAYDALLAERDEYKAKAERMHKRIREGFDRRPNGSKVCHLCGTWSAPSHYERPEAHKDGCECTPDFLTTSATESREAKGGEQC